MQRDASAASVSAFDTVLLPRRRADAVAALAAGVRDMTRAYGRDHPLVARVRALAAERGVGQDE